MNNGGEKGPQKGACPFLKSECIGQECALWTRFKISQQSSLFGMGKTGTGEGCVFNVIALATIASMGPSMPPPILGRQ